ncbi:MAG: hypothetical protein H8E70_00345 [Candidatus Marinimicrobia bacterium]|nr:hypothetical protein [Candidatus Neomarinimicrobiota bacterium]
MKQIHPILKNVILALIMISSSYSQLIHSLANQSIFLTPPDTTDVYSAFNIQHGYHSDDGQVNGRW